MIALPHIAFFVLHILRKLFENPNCHKMKRDSWIKRSKILFCSWINILFPPFLLQPCKWWIKNKLVSGKKINSRTNLFTFIVPVQYSYFRFNRIHRMQSMWQEYVYWQDMDWCKFNLNRSRFSWRACFRKIECTFFSESSPLTYIGICGGVSMWCEAEESIIRTFFYMCMNTSEVLYSTLKSYRKVFLCGEGFLQLEWKSFDDFAHLIGTYHSSLLLTPC